MDNRGLLAAVVCLVFKNKPNNKQKSLTSNKNVNISIRHYLFLFFFEGCQESVYKESFLVK